MTIGNDEAALELSKIYKYGMGVLKDLVKAKKWAEQSQQSSSCLDKHAKDAFGLSNLNLIKTSWLGLLERESISELKDAKQDSSPNLIVYGNYHAIVIGNNDYNNLPQLKSAVFDAETVEETLRTQFNFKTMLIKNASRSQILDALYDYRETLTKNDNLLIYYAGHGYLDKKINKGYWQPVDAHSERKSNWISNSDVVDELKGIKAKHIMIVSDSCFSGTLSRGLEFESSTINVDREWIEKMSQTPGRTVMTSGNLEPVADSGAEGHSVFAYYFLKELNGLKGPTTGDQLFSKIKHKVQLNAAQKPIYQQIKNAGGEGGDFIFVKGN